MGAAVCTVSRAAACVPAPAGSSALGEWLLLLLLDSACSACLGASCAELCSGLKLALPWAGGAGSAELLPAAAGSWVCSS